MSTRRVGMAAVVVLTSVASILVGGAAVADWSDLFSGTGSAATGTTAAVTLSPGSVDGTLYPGGSADLSLTISNTNTTAVRLETLALDTGEGTGGFAVDAGHSGCATSSFSFTPPAGGRVDLLVPGSSVEAHTLPDAVTMSATAADACQGATVTVYVSGS